MARERFVGFRHSYVSMQIASGLIPIEVSRRAGHTPSMTLDVYGWVYEDWEGRQIDVEAEIRKARTPGAVAKGAYDLTDPGGWFYPPNNDVDPKQNPKALALLQEWFFPTGEDGDVRWVDSRLLR